MDFSYFYLLLVLILIILRRDAISTQKQHLAALLDTEYRYSRRPLISMNNAIISFVNDVTELAPTLRNFGNGT